MPAMKRFKHARGAKAAVTAVMLVALTGCTSDGNTVVNFFEFVQTILLGVTAAGSYAILRNV